MDYMLHTSNLEDYRRFLRIKSLPKYSIRGRVASYPDEYAAVVNGASSSLRPGIDYQPASFLFDYQSAIARLAIQKRRFCVFADCGLGKTLIYFEFIRHAMTHGGGALLVCPKMVIPQLVEEYARFYGDAVDVVEPRDLDAWLPGCDGSFGVTNFESFTQRRRRGQLNCLVIDESSMLKSHYGKWGTELLRIGKRIEWKMAGSGTPAPNDRIEYANHAVLMDAAPNANAFLARYFVNRGQTGERWELKAHAVEAFYKSLAHWCIFLADPATYGWQDNTTTIPPIHVHIEHVDMTAEQEEIAFKKQGRLFAGEMGGIGTRSAYGQLAKGRHKGRDVPTNKYLHIVDMLQRWPDESTIIWCLYNDEQTALEKHIPDAVSIRGSTKHEDRLTMIDQFKRGERRVLITKPKILGFGLNLQVATRQIFSGLQDSYEQYYQAVKRSNRVGSTKPLNVHIPLTELESPMVETVLRKAKMIEADTAEQERSFKQWGAAWLGI